MTIKKTRIQCSVPLCYEINQNDEKNQRKTMNYFSYPEDADRCVLWMIICQTEHLADKLTGPNNYRVCDIHFEDDMFLNLATRAQLTRNAVPTIFKFDTMYDQQKKKLVAQFNNQTEWSILNDHNYCKNVY